MDESEEREGKLLFGDSEANGPVQLFVVLKMSSRIVDIDHTRIGVDQDRICHGVTFAPYPFWSKTTLKPGLKIATAAARR